MRGDVYVIDRAVDQPNGQGYDIVETREFQSWTEVKAAWDVLPDPPKGTTFYLGRKQSNGGCVTLVCK